MSTAVGFLSVKHAEVGSWIFNAINLETDNNAIGFDEEVIPGTYSIDMDTFVASIGGAAIAINADAEIRGVSAVLKYLSREGGVAVPIDIQLRQALGLMGTAKSEAGSAIKVTANLGGATDLWGSSSIPVAIINSTGFGVRVEFTQVAAVGPANDCWGYYLPITIHYSVVSGVDPAGGEVLRDNHTVEITWTDGGGTTVEIDLYKDGILLTNIASGVTASDESYDWEIDVDVSGDDYTIRITDNGSGDTDDSAADFTILTSAEKTLNTALTGNAATRYDATK